MTTIRLLYWKGACSLAAHILLNELKVPYTPVQYTGTQEEKDELRKLNPKMKIPVLDIDGQVITENVAILTAIAQLAPDRNLLGKTDLEILRSYEYLSFLAGSLHGQAYGALFRPNRFSDDESMHQSIRDAGKRQAVECYELIENKLEGVHAVGNQLTVVDPYLYVFWRWGATNVSDMEKRYPKYAALVSELAKLNSVKQTLEEEGIDGHIPSKL